MRLCGFRSANTSTSWEFLSQFARLGARGFSARTFLDTSGFLSYNQAIHEFPSPRCRTFLLSLKHFQELASMVPATLCPAFQQVADGSL